MRIFLQYILKQLSKATLWRYKPRIIAVTGSVGKTNTKEAIYYVLKKKFRTRRNIKNYNNEIGVPLTILGSYICPPARISSLFSWFVIFLKSIKMIIYQKNYPEVLILEMGIRKPDDMKYLMNFVKINTAVVTGIGQYPSHLEFFKTRDDLIKEKGFLVECLPQDGWAIFNSDDEAVKKIAQNTPKKVKIINYGVNDKADLKIGNYDLQDFGVDPASLQCGTSFKVNYKGSYIPIRLTGTTGEQAVFAVSAAISVGISFGLNLVEISLSFGGYHALPGRGNILKGIKQTWLIDDTYNASPLSTITALELLDEVGKKRKARKIAVLGDMLELGENTEIGHRQVGEKISKMADILFIVGSRANFIAEEAQKRGLAEDKIFKFTRSEDAGIPLQDEIKKGDIILIKGSRGMAMEKITKEIMAHPEKAEELLVS